MVEDIQTTQKGIIRDESYYFEDGSCVFLIENCLFNLHRSILRRSSNFFQTMFTVPQSVIDERGTAEGMNDDHPIKCDDSLEAFRAWCWAIYAGMNELKGSDESKDFAEERFAHIGSLAHKYECNVIEKWAREELDAKLAASPRPSVSLLEYIITTSIRCSWPSIGATAERLLLETIGGTRGTRPGVSNTGSELSTVLDFANSIGDADLKARAYYTFLQSMEWNLSPKTRGILAASSTAGRDQEWWDSLDASSAAGSDNQVQEWWDSLDALTDRQKICLYRGFIALSSVKHQLQNFPSRNYRVCHCNRYSNFQNSWVHQAASLEARGPPYNDPKEFIQEMKRTVSFGRDVCGHHNGCWMNEFRGKVERLSQDLDNPERFFTE
ncbi:hypothetical protein AN958_05817 [Leucoagaricus sp. SymC.cos]|nr:hypothetical protein AN958_05817 [Leucoagaricus sp. SymC.cos]